jgi:hypothetical protein
MRRWESGTAQLDSPSVLRSEPMPARRMLRDRHQAGGPAAFPTPCRPARAGRGGTRAAAGSPRQAPEQDGSPRRGRGRQAAGGTAAAVLEPTSHRNPAVRNGLQRYIVRAGRRGDPAEAGRVQNPDNDEVQVLPALGSTCGRRGPSPPSSAGRHRTPRHTSPLARCRGHCIERSRSTQRQSAPQERMGSPWSVRRLVIPDIRS